MYRLVPTPTFEDNIKKLDKFLIKRILNKLEYLAKNPNLAKSVKYLPKDLEGLQKYRIGDWRVLFWRDNKKEEIILYGVDNRDSIYRRLR